MNHKDVQCCEICDAQKPNMFTRIKGRTRGRKLNSSQGSVQDGDEVKDGEKSVPDLGKSMGKRTKNNKTIDRKNKLKHKAENRTQSAPNTDEGLQKRIGNRKVTGLENKSSPSMGNFFRKRTRDIETDKNRKPIIISDPDCRGCMDSSEKGSTPMIRTEVTVIEESDCSTITDSDSEMITKDGDEHKSESNLENVRALLENGISSGEVNNDLLALKNMSEEPGLDISKDVSTFGDELDENESIGKEDITLGFSDKPETTVFPNCFCPKSYTAEISKVVTPSSCLDKCAAGFKTAAVLFAENEQDLNSKDTGPVDVLGASQKLSEAEEFFGDEDLDFDMTNEDLAGKNHRFFQHKINYQ